MIILRRVRAPRSGFDEYQHIIGFVYLVYTPLRTRCYLPLFNSNLKITLL